MCVHAPGCICLCVYTRECVCLRLCAYTDMGNYFLNQDSPTTECPLRRRTYRLAKHGWLITCRFHLVKVTPERPGPIMTSVTERRGIRFCSAVTANAV